MKSAEQLDRAYTEALAHLCLHPSLIWTRNNFFLLVNRGLSVFAVSGQADAWEVYNPVESDTYVQSHPR